MKNLALVVFLAAALCISFSAARAASPTLAQEARALNQQSKANFGVGIRALLLLFDAQPGTHELKYGLLHDGSWPYLEELQHAGLVEVTADKGLSYDTAPSSAWLSISLTRKGQQIRDALSAH